MAMLTKGHIKSLIARDKDKTKRAKEAAKHKKVVRLCAPKKVSNKTWIILKPSNKACLSLEGLFLFR